MKNQQLILLHEHLSKIWKSFKITSYQQSPVIISLYLLKYSLILEESNPFFSVQKSDMTHDSFLGAHKIGPEKEMRQKSIKFIQVGSLENYRILFFYCLETCRILSSMQKKILYDVCILVLYP